MSSTELQELAPDRHSSKSSKSGHGSDDLDDEARVCFIQPGKEEVSVKNQEIEFNGLSKEELMKYQNDPFWKKVRLILFILFWVIWAAMIIAAVLIIYFTPKCAPIPKKSFWQKSSGYLIDVPTFKDSNGDGIGDLKGVVEKLNYLESKGGYIIIKSVLKGSLGTKDMRAPTVTNFKEIDERVGSMEDIKKIIKAGNKKQLKILLEFSFNTGKDHDWFKKAAKGDKKFKDHYFWSPSALTSKMVNRVGKSVWNKIGSEFYWSSLDESLPALNVQDKNVQAALKDAVQFWLKQGFSGVFVDNAAFLAPDIASKDVGKGLDVASITTGDLKMWYSSGHTGQLLTDNAVKFIITLRSWVNEVRDQAGRELFLLVSPGNTGLEHSHNQTLSLLGTDIEPAAHSVVLFNIMPSQGQKVVPSKKTVTIRQSLDLALSSKSDRVVLMTQTVSGPRVDDATLTFMNLLLPSSAISVYGEEIGMKGYGDKLPKVKTGPGLPYSFITKAAFADSKAYLYDLVDAWNVPMQWTPSGGFSQNITYENANNVMSMSTLGREMTRYKVFIALVKLRKEPSLNWGQMKWIESEEKKNPHYFIFTRAAKGFPKYLIVLIRPTLTSGGLDRDMSGVCTKAKVKLSYPINSEFVPDKPLPMKNIFFRYSPKGSAYIFQCV